MTWWPLWDSALTNRKQQGLIIIITDCISNVQQIRVIRHQVSWLLPLISLRNGVFHRFFFFLGRCHVECFGEAFVCYFYVFFFAYGEESILFIIEARGGEIGRLHLHKMFVRIHPCCHVDSRLRNVPSSPADISDGFSAVFSSLVVVFTSAFYFALCHSAFETGHTLILGASFTFCSVEIKKEKKYCCDWGKRTMVARSLHTETSTLLAKPCNNSGRVEYAL